MRAIGEQKRHVFYETNVGEDFCLVSQGWVSKEKGMKKGLSDNYIPVVYTSSPPSEGPMVRVRTEKRLSNSVLGRLIGPCTQYRFS
jgi:hypothetical protein